MSVDVMKDNIHGGDLEDACVIWVWHTAMIFLNILLTLRVP